MAPAPSENNALHGQMFVYVTRDGATAAELELLVYEDAQSTMPRVPSTAVQAGEHLAEAALRCAVSQSGFDVYFTFRKLRSGDGRHYYQTSPEVDLPASFAQPDPERGTERRYYWLPEREALVRLSAPDDRALTDLDLHKTHKES